MEFGKKKTITNLDDDGSIKEDITSYRDGKVSGNIKEYYEIRHKVSNDLEEYAQFNSFYKEYTADPTILDPVFKTEGRLNRDGRRFAIHCYTRIVR